jgi:hypothetical protein
MVQAINEQQTIRLAASEDDSRVELNGTFLVDDEGLRLRSNPPIEPPKELTTVPNHPDSLRLQSQQQDLDGDWPGKEMVANGSNLLPFHFLRTGDRMGRAVVKIQRNDGATGTGFLVASDVILTNHHVLPNPEIASAAVAMANFEVSPPNDPEGRQAVSPLDPETLFITNPDLDFTFCGVQGLSFLGSIPLDRERMHIAPEETVTIIQHPRGRPKEIALRDNRVVRADGVVVQYSCDTEPGSSGSPVFNNQWKPVAIHHASVLTDSPEGRRIAVNSRARYLNEGIRLSAISLWLESPEAGLPAQQEQVSRLRSLFGGINSHAGFFGALGRRSHGRPSIEVVADTYRNKTDVIDIGYWDTRQIVTTKGSLREEIPEIGRAIAEMGLNVWCFSHADSHGLELIRAHLWAVYSQNYQTLSTAGDQTDFAPRLLMRLSRSMAIEPLDDGSGMSPIGARLRVQTHQGLEVDFRIVPLNKPIEAKDVTKTLRLTYGADSLSSTMAGQPLSQMSGWLFFGCSNLLKSLKQYELIDDDSRIVVSATSPDTGIVILNNESRDIEQVFLSNSLQLKIDQSRRVTVVQDRILPACVTSVIGPVPIAIRVSLDSADSDQAIPAQMPYVTAPYIPRPGVNLSLIIEQKLRDIIEPVLTELILKMKEHF